MYTDPKVRYHAQFLRGTFPHLVCLTVKPYLKCLWFMLFAVTDIHLPSTPEQGHLAFRFRETGTLYSPFQSGTRTKCKFDLLKNLSRYIETWGPGA